ncbi:MAG: ribonucleotide reductase N-terminal alpha domain-containing protein, partial [Sulfurimonadaceae bacterium]
MITIIKRNGRTEKLDITKIQKYTSAAVEGLSNVSQSELEVDAQIQFRDGITSKEIQQTLIKTAVDKIDIDAPNWTFVASRLFLFILYHQGNGFTGYSSLKSYFEKGEKEGRLLLGLKEMYNLEELEKHIKPERDMQFNYLGVKTLYDRYLIKDRNSNPIELPQHMFMAIAMFLAQKEKNREEWALKFYNMISTFEVMLATPTLSNARTTRHQLSSCYIGSTPDNIEGIFDSYKEMALLSKFGGGIGWDWTNVRSMGSYIDGHKNAAGGTIPFLKITNDIAVAVDQLGTRKGAIAVYMEPWHIDINDFLDLKKNSGEERRRAHDLFPALWINDLFMQRVEEDGIWTLFDPYDCSELT